ncbi:hypothetical protein C8F04DRAFT_374770 [Mycena alexandri]|uniref:F-box domain-containing protein n=1 Tax=Mycena alexandri TaxID=1745969 RepID=A0AAD6T3P5_9AGAR|nr:hypothetical protein C8F04DRAFT_374770 [Mycena alexandri]
MAPTLATIPGELIIQIFATLIEDSGDEPREPAVLRLSRICESLRDLVLTTPVLWSRIRLCSSQDMRAVNLFLRRSQDCLLDVYVYLDFLDHFVHLVQTYAVARWRKLTIQGPLWTEIAAILKEIVEIQTPQLKEVRLITRERFDCNEHEPRLLSGGADALRTLTMHGCVGCLSPFPNLTRLNIFRLLCTYEEFRDLIQGLPNLTTLILNRLLDRFDIEDPEPVAIPRSTIEASALRFFAVGFTNTELISSSERPPLAFLSMPNLEYLEVSGSRTDYGELSGKSFPALHTLCLRNMSFQASDATLFRSLAAKIIHLQLNDVRGVEQLLEPDEKGALPWPHLQTLAWNLSYEETSDENCSWLENLSTRPRLILKIPEAFKGNVSAVRQYHDVQFLSDDPLGLIRAKDFVGVYPASIEEEEDSDFSDQGDYFYEDDDNLDFEYDLEDQMEDYSGDDYDDDWDGVV